MIELQARLGQLGAHDQGHHAADQEERERGDQVQVADHLVVGGRHPLGDDRALAGRRVRAPAAGGSEYRRRSLGTPGSWAFVAWR